MGENQFASANSFCLNVILFEDLEDIVNKTS